MSSLWVQLLTGLISLHVAENAKILGIFHVPSYSHFNPPNELMKDIARRGHQVTVIGPFVEKEKVPNYKKIEIASDIPLNTEGKSLFDILQKDLLKYTDFLIEYGYVLTKRFFEQPNVQEFLKDNHTYDLVIFEDFLSPSLRGICRHFKVPCIAYSSINLIAYIDPLYANPTPISYVSDFMLAFPEHMTFPQRTINLLYYVYSMYKYHYDVLPKHDALLKKYLPKVEGIYELVYEDSLLLLNSHISYNYATPKMPNIVEIGGFHVKNQRQPLPKDLKSFLDGAKEGVVYFSMGSVLKSRDIPKEKLVGFLKAFSRIKLKVLWKFEEDALENLPKNVKIFKWIPQQDVLAHPNVKVFISHGGLFSTIEAVYFGVPVIGLPVFGDQRANMLAAQRKGYGIALEYSTVTEDSLHKALIEITSNSNYYENAKLRSSIMLDQPMDPKQKAIYWVEHALKTKGAKHLRSAGLDLTWYQYQLFDVIGSLILISITCVFVIVYCTIRCCRTLSAKSTKVD